MVPLPGEPKIVALFYGPIALAGELDLQVLPAQNLPAIGAALERGANQRHAGQHAGSAVGVVQRAGDLQCLVGQRARRPMPAASSASASCLSTPSIASSPSDRTA